MRLRIVAVLLAGCLPACGGVGTRPPLVDPAFITHVNR